MDKALTSLLLVLFILASCSGSRDESIYMSPASMVQSQEISNRNITAIAEDAQGFIWMGTERGLNRYDSREFRQFFYNPDNDNSLCSNRIGCLFVDSSDRLWVGTVNGVCRYTRQGDFIRVKAPRGFINVYQVLENREGRILFNTIEQLYEWIPEADSMKVLIKDFDPGKHYSNDCHIDSSGDIWSVLDGEVRCYDGSTLELRKSIQTGIRPHFSYLSSTGVLWVMGEKTIGVDTHTAALKPLPQVLEDEESLLDNNGSIIYETEGKAFISTGKHMLMYDIAGGSILRENEKGFPFKTPEGIITQMYSDSQNNLWFAIRDRGFAIRYNFIERFNSDVLLSAGMQGRSVVSMSTDSHGILWMMDVENNLFSYDENTGSVKSYLSKRLFEFKRISDPSMLILMDSEDNLWAVQPERLCKLDCRQEDCRLVESYEIPNRISCILEDSCGTIWLGTGSRNLYYKRKEEKHFSCLEMDAPALTMASAMRELSGGRLFVSFFSGNPVTVDIETMTPTLLSGIGKLSLYDYYTDVTEAPDGSLWLGTKESGLYLYDYQKNSTESIEGLSCGNICSVIGDEDGNVWVSTLDGLSKYVLKDRTIVNYSASDGLGGKQFNEKSAARLPSGKLVFGGTHGVTVFDPYSSVPKRDVPLYFTHLRINGRPVRGGNAVMDRMVEYLPEVTLKHSQNDFSIDIIAPDYREHEQIHYYYTLEGYEREQHDLGSSRTINLVNVPPGKYTLKASIHNNDQTISDHETALSIRVLPAWWQTWWAKLLYLMTFAGLVTFFISSRARVLKGRREAARLQQEKEQERKVNEMNMRFFANISHEFRTPLTLISGPVTQLEGSGTLPPKERKLLEMIRYNVSRMLRLVNQVLDFGKLDSDAMKLQVRHEDLSELLGRIVRSFEPNASEKGIVIRTSGIEEPLRGYFDADKIEKILSNLMSNAMKYTPKGGVISCSLDSREDMLTISVSDDGPSIPEDKLERIFERYYQIDPSQGFGTGIGLYYSRRLAMLHHGSVHAENIPGGGVSFVAELPQKDVYAPGEHAPDAPVVHQSDAFPIMAAEASQKEHEKTILVIDDDPSIVGYLRLLLREDYGVLEEFDAGNGLASLKENLPDLVLCDVSMPGEDGFEFCRKAKEDLSTCHIPVILVTAKTTKSDQIQGLETGADAYVTKPFDPDYLKALIASQLSNRERVRSLLATATRTDDLAKDSLSSRDREFMDRLYSIMEEELDNEELNISSLADKMFLSRTNLYNKVKGLTGEKPGDFFRSYKLNRAAEFLLDGDHNVSEAAYATGFSSLSVFSRVFKQRFGITPTEYVKSRTEGRQGTN
jgi:signal transduction histidine kinase/DNA-binding response OmpR family regulator/ligand-binding sensor domain-containing protein